MRGDEAPEPSSSGGGTRRLGGEGGRWPCGTGAATRCFCPSGAMETDPLREVVYCGTVFAGILGGSGGGVLNEEDSVLCGEIVSCSNRPVAKDAGSSLTPPPGCRPYCAPARRRSEAPVGLRCGCATGEVGGCCAWALIAGHWPRSWDRESGGGAIFSMDQTETQTTTKTNGDGIMTTGPGPACRSRARVA